MGAVPEECPGVVLYNFSASYDRILPLYVVHMLASVQVVNFRHLDCHWHEMDTKNARFLKEYNEIRVENVKVSAVMR